MKNTLIVTGGAGFIGSNLIKELAELKKYKIISIDNYSTGTKFNHVNSKSVKYINTDIKNIEKICNKIKNKILVLFHFGEYARIHQSFTDTSICFDTNISGTQKVINFCAKNKIKIIYSATSASLGNRGNDQNLSPYAFSKSNNLKLILNMNKWFGLKYEILYFYNVYGPGQIMNGRMATVIGIFEYLYKKKKPLLVAKPGSQTRKFTHIKDTIKGCIYAWKKNRNREYALFNKKSYTILEVAKMFSNKIKLIPHRKGERFRSAQINSIEKRKIYKIDCKISLQTYIKHIKLGM